MWPRRTAVALLLIISLPVVAATGCGGAAGGEGVATLEGAATTAAEAGPEAAGEADLEGALLAFTACMREEGVDLPDPEFDAEGNLKLVSLMAEAGLAVSRAGGAEAMREAASACRHHLQGVALRFASMDRTEMQDRLLEYAACMRENGFDMPDPDFSGGARPGLGGPFPGLRFDVLQNPEFTAANEECQGIFTAPLPSSSEDGAGG